MTQTRQRFYNFDDYLSYDDGTKKLYELFNGELIEVPPESGFNVGIANFLFATFLPFIGHLRLRGHGLELEVRGEPRNRCPDLTVIREEHIELLQKRNTIRLFMAPPDLVIEVVSPGDLQRDRNYVAKRVQYQDRGIPEYWLVDPELKTLTVLELQDLHYREVGSFSGNDSVISARFPGLRLTVDQIFGAGR